MVRKTREQVWRELDGLGEEEVRRRLAARPADVEEPGLVHEWLLRQERVKSALADTSSRIARRAGLTSGVGRVAGTVLLLGAAAVGLGYVLARRKR
ncbi:MAG TPA: hypothetical protein VF046_05370 [Gemmatimonadales bacterium]